MRFSTLLAISSSAAVAAMLLSAGSALAAVPSVQMSGNTYYKVDGNNPAMDTGKEVCASMGKQCLGYKSVNTNAICKLFHPTAKEMTSVNGSKAGFYCNGAPQQGLACAPYKNTCEVCPACNLNEAASCDQPIGQHFAEMYVWCGANSSPMYGPLPLPKSSARSSSRRTSSSPAVDSRIGNQPGYKVCEYYQSTNAGDPVRATKKLVSCGVPGLGDQFCRTALNNPAAKALKCEEHGIVVCGLPCTTPGARNEWFCSADINRPRGTMVKPLDFCPPLPASSSPMPTKKPGELCQHGGECTTGNCVGEGPDFGKVYRCSCNPFRLEYGCASSSSPSLPATGRAPGQKCDHGGQCQSGMCLGAVPGQLYLCSCNDPKTQWQNCRK